MNSEEKEEYDSLSLLIPFIDKKFLINEIIELLSQKFEDADLVNNNLISKGYIRMEYPLGETFRFNCLYSVTPSLHLKGKKVKLI